MTIDRFTQTQTLLAPVTFQGESQSYTDVAAAAHMQRCAASIGVRQGKA